MKKGIHTLDVCVVRYWRKHHSLIYPAEMPNIGENLSYSISMHKYIEYFYIQSILGLRQPGR